MKPLLSILIPTTLERTKEYFSLIDRIFSYFPGINKDSEVEMITDMTGKEMTIGEKREKLYNNAIGLYSWQIDDDDDIAPNAIQLILEAIKNNPEIPCITFRERCMMNGEYKSSNHSIKYEKWQDNFDGYDYVRCPFYKDVIRTDLAKQVPFQRVRWNEDELFSMAIKPLLTNEIHIEEELYYYIYNETNHEERYGLNKD